MYIIRKYSNIDVHVKILMQLEFWTPVPTILGLKINLLRISSLRSCGYGRGFGSNSWLQGSFLFDEILGLLLGASYKATCIWDVSVEKMNITWLHGRDSICLRVVR
jgi:hypothetical protein